MNVLWGAIGAVAWVVFSVLPALSSADLANLLAAAARWLSRAGRALWPDVPE